MMTIRGYANKAGFEVVGKLERISAPKGRGEIRLYMDDKGNEYWVSKKGICIVTSHGGVI